MSSESNKLLASTTMVTVRVEIRDEDHFNRIASYLDKEIGPGRQNWRINVPVRKHLRRGKAIRRNILIRKDAEGAKSLSLFLSLL